MGLILIRNLLAFKKSKTCSLMKSLKLHTAVIAFRGTQSKVMISNGLHIPPKIPKEACRIRLRTRNINQFNNYHIFTSQSFTQTSKCFVQASAGVPKLVWQLIANTFSHEKTFFINLPENKFDFVEKNPKERDKIIPSSLANFYYRVFNPNEKTFQLVYNRFDGFN